MDIKKATVRFTKARAAIENLKESECYAHFESAWLDFLLHSNGVYTQLEQAAKIREKDSGWFGRKKSERKTDELLSYLLHARNADEHTVAQVTEFKPGELHIGKRSPGMSEAIRVNGNISTGLFVESLDGKPVLIENRRSRIECVTVRDRGKSYFPPTKHKGQDLTDNSPIKIAELMMTHLEALLDEASPDI